MIRVYHETFRDWDEDDDLPDEDNQVMEAWVEGDLIFRAAVPCNMDGMSIYDRYPDPPLRDFTVRIKSDNFRWLYLFCAGMALSGKL